MTRALGVFVVLALAGCPAPPPASPHCVSNTTLQFKRIDERVAKYRAGDRAPGGVYWARYYLETARFVLTGKGIDGSGAACTERDHESREAKQLRKELAAHEKDVVWMEQQRGVAFTGVVHAGLTWTWTQNHSPVAQNDANTL